MVGRILSCKELQTLLDSLGAMRDVVVQKHYSHCVHFCISPIHTGKHVQVSGDGAKQGSPHGSEQDRKLAPKKLKTRLRDLTSRPAGGKVILVF